MYIYIYLYPIQNRHKYIYIQIFKSFWIAPFVEHYPIVISSASCFFTQTCCCNMSSISTVLQILPLQGTCEKKHQPEKISANCSEASGCTSPKPHFWRHPKWKDSGSIMLRHSHILDCSLMMNKTLVKQLARRHVTTKARLEYFIARAPKSF